MKPTRIAWDLLSVPLFCAALWCGWLAIPGALWASASALLAGIAFWCRSGD